MPSGFCNRRVISCVGVVLRYTCSISVAMLLQCCSTSTELQRLGCGTAPWQCCGTAAAQLRHCYSTAATLLRHCCGAAAAVPQRTCGVTALNVQLFYSNAVAKGRSSLSCVLFCVTVRITLKGREKTKKVDIIDSLSLEDISKFACCK